MCKTKNHYGNSIVIFLLYGKLFLVRYCVSVSIAAHFNKTLFSLPVKKLVSLFCGSVGYCDIAGTSVADLVVDLKIVCLLVSVNNLKNCRALSCAEVNLKNALVVLSL